MKDLLAILQYKYKTSEKTIEQRLYKDYQRLVCDAADNGNACMEINYKNKAEYASIINWCELTDLNWKDKNNFRGNCVRVSGWAE